MNPYKYSQNGQQIEFHWIIYSEWISFCVLIFLDGYGIGIWLWQDGMAWGKHLEQFRGKTLSLATFTNKRTILIMNE